MAKKKAKVIAKEQSNKVSEGMSYADAAEKILREQKKVLKYKKLADLAVKENLVQTESKTPDLSMYVSLRADIKRRKERGEPARFAFLGNGLFTLVELVTGKPTTKTQSAIEQVRESRKQACQELYKALTTKNHGPEFETMVADLLINLGYEDVEVIGGKDDQGVDIVCGKRDGILLTRIAIQCKCKLLSNMIGPKDISTLRDNLSTYQCQRGILITTSRLNEAAKTKAKESGKDPIHYIEHGELLDLFAQQRIGIRSESVSFFQVDNAQYDFLKD